MSKEINETTKLKEQSEQLSPNEINNDQNKNLNTSQEQNSSLYNDPQYRALLNHFGGQIPKLRPELQQLKEQVLHFGSDIIDGEDDKKYEDRPYFEKLGHKLYQYWSVFEHYLHAFLAVGAATAKIYFTNLFYNLYFNPKIKKYYLLHKCSFIYY